MKNKEGYWVKAMFLCASYPWLDGYLVKASAFVCKSFMALWGDLILERGPMGDKNQANEGNVRKSFNKVVLKLLFYQG